MEKKIIIRLPDLKKRTGASRSFIYNAIKKGAFPAPISLGGGRAVGWIESDVDDWIESRITASRTVVK